MRVWRFAATIAVFVGLCLPLAAQSRRLGGGVFPGDKFSFYWDTHLEPPMPDLQYVSSDSGSDKGVIHRFLVDSSRRVYFGYDVAIEVLPEPNAYRMTFRRLSMSPEYTRRALSVDDLSGWTQVPTAGWAEPTVRTIRGGEVLAMTLLTNERTGQKIVDYVTVQEPSRPGPDWSRWVASTREFAYASGPARDFRVQDAELRLQGPRVSINGAVDASTTRVDAQVIGVAVWFYLPMRGRYILSLTPHAGLRRAGEIRGTTLSFTLGNESYIVNCAAQIAPGPGPFNLYVLHEPSWRPTYANANTSAFISGAADSVELLIRK